MDKMSLDVGVSDVAKMVGVIYLFECLGMQWHDVAI